MPERKELETRHKMRCHLSIPIRETVKKVARAGLMRCPWPVMWPRGMGATSCGHLRSVTSTLSKIRSHCMVLIRGATFEYVV